MEVSMKRSLLLTLLSMSLLSCSCFEKKEQVTPFDQYENEIDRTISQKIRQSLIGDKSLSLLGKNVKVISQNGKVTLRGPVASREERQLIVKKASETQGV